MSELDYHSGPVTAVHSRAGLLASGGKDGTVRLWDLAISSERHRWTNPSPVRSVYIAPSGLKIFAGLEGKLARMSLDTVPTDLNIVDLGWSCPVVCLACSSTKPNRVCMAGFEGSSILYKQATVQRRNTEESGTGGSGAGRSGTGGSGAGRSGTGGSGAGGSGAGGSGAGGFGAGDSKEGGSGAGRSVARPDETRAREGVTGSKGSEQDLLTQGVLSAQGLMTQMVTKNDVRDQHEDDILPEVIGMETTAAERGELAGTGVDTNIEDSSKAEPHTFLKTGRLFESETEVFAFVESYSSSHRTAFNCSSNNKKQVQGRLALDM